MVVITHASGFELVFKDKKDLLHVIQALEHLLLQTNYDDAQEPWVYAVGDEDGMTVGELDRRIEWAKDGRIPF